MGNNEISDRMEARLSFWRRRRIPILLQTESSECGLACLAMVAGFYGKNIDLITLRQDYGVSSRGMTLVTMSSIASNMGFSARPLSLNIDNFPHIKKPCILHWGFNHFVVLVWAGNKRFVIHDPASGRRTIGGEELSSYFTGIALELMPEVGFVPETRIQRVKIIELLKNISGFRSAMFKLFFLSLIIEFISLLIPIGTQLIMDNAIPAGDKSLLMLICLSLIVLIMLQAGISVFRAWTTTVMSTLIDLQWKNGLFQHLVRLPLCWFEKRRPGDIQSRFGSLETLRTTFTQNITGAVIDSIMAVGSLVMLILYGGVLAWVVVGFTGLYIMIRILTFSRYRQSSEELLIKNARAGSCLTETLYGIATIRAQGLADLRRQNWLNLVTDAANTSISTKRFDILFSVISTFINACDNIIILWLGISSVIDHKLTIGAFVAFSSFRGMFSERLLSLTVLFLQLRMLSLHNERIADIALSSPEPEKPAQTIFPQGVAITLVAENLSYRYDNHSPFIFTGLNIVISAGESVAIVGSSGAGKTTLMKILCGLTAPCEGFIRADGRDIHDAGINNYRHVIACILQEDRLFAGSLRENITGFNQVVDEEWMEQCAKLSNIHEDIIKLPMGYETLTGELGEGLSGGQKQRLFIARALYRRPGILFMDEATSHLDEVNEAAINLAIKNLRITRIIIAHRPSTIASASRVICLDRDGQAGTLKV